MEKVDRTERKLPEPENDHIMSYKSNFDTNANMITKDIVPETPGSMNQTKTPGQIYSSARRRDNMNTT